MTMTMVTKMKNFDATRKLIRLLYAKLFVIIIYYYYYIANTPLARTVVVWQWGQNAVYRFAHSQNRFPIACTTTYTARFPQPLLRFFQILFRTHYSRSVYE